MNTKTANKTANTLITAFTSTNDLPEGESIYHVTGETGSIIAQKVSQGAQIIVCRNGELVRGHDNNSKQSYMDSVQLNR